MARKKDPAVETLDQALKTRTIEGILYEKVEDGKVRCYSCGHRCVIPDGFDGICRVRYNRGGTLYVPRGYVAGLQVDPIEKKPFFHAFPGAVALSFGMLGCDYHCSYCFAPGTRVLTSRGHVRIEDLYEARSKGKGGNKGHEQRDHEPAHELACHETPDHRAADFEATTHGGRSQPITHVFQHHFNGNLIRIKPACLPEILATPDHPFLAVRRDAGAASPRRETMAGDKAPEEQLPARPAARFVPAGDLAPGDLLVVPKEHEFSEDVVLRAADHLAPFASVFRAPHTIGGETLRRVLSLTQDGRSSREIGAALGLGASHVRHLRGKLARGAWDLDRLEEKRARVIEEDGRIRYSKEHRPGVPAEIPLDDDLAWLLGLFCAEGSVARSANRPRAASLIFSFGHHEAALADEVSRLLKTVFGLSPRLVRRTTTLCVELGKASAALFFQALCGTGSRAKKVPECLFRAHRPIVEAFLRGYVDGDGYRSPAGSTTVSTVSPELAAGVAGLLIKLGILPQWYSYAQPTSRLIQGRSIEQADRVHVVRWHPERKRASNVLDAGDRWLVPIRSLSSQPYEGPVYNLEVEQDHTYLANGIAVHNCQNWLTSQALRDSEALEPPRDVTADELVAIARKHRAPVMVSTYNEPLITSEWAIEVFSRAKAEGIVCGYISNGNGTPQVLEFIRPYVDLYKVDLKSFRDASYRALGGTLQNVVETIRALHEKGFWLEIVTLLIPGFNDSKEELRDLTSFLVSVSPDIPWHVTAFHQDYRMTDKADTTALDLIGAAAIGQAAGLRYVYAGNLPGRVGDLENTRCWKCRELLIERHGYRILGYRITGEGRCPACATPIAGFWQSEWKVPEKDGGLPGRYPRPVPIPAARVFDR